MKEITIHTEFIKLNQLLKWAGIAESGAKANAIIGDGHIKINDELETRRGKKVYPGDKVIFDNKHKFLIVREGSAESASGGIEPDKL